MSLGKRKAEIADLLTVVDHVREALVRAGSSEAWADFDADLADAILSLSRLGKDASALQRRAARPKR